MMFSFFDDDDSGGGGDMFLFFSLSILEKKMCGGNTGCVTKMHDSARRYVSLEL